MITTSGCLLIPRRWCLIAPPISKPFRPTEAVIFRSLSSIALFRRAGGDCPAGKSCYLKISGPMVVKSRSFLIFGFAMIPHTGILIIFPPFPPHRFLRDVLLTIPFCFFSAVFIQVPNPMNIAHRKREPDRVLATRMAIARILH